MKKISLFSFFLLICLQANIAQKRISLDDCFTSFSFFAQSNSDLRFTPDGAHYLKKTKEGLELVNVSDGNEDRLMVPQTVLDAVGDWDDVTFTQDLSAFLFRSDSRPVYRHSVKASYWWYHRTKDELRHVEDSQDLQFAVLSPDGHKVAYVFDNNLFIKDFDTNERIKVSSDGQDAAIINGLPDWLYEEEFSPVSGEGMVATEWSPDSKKLAFIRFDEGAVPEVDLTFYEDSLYPRRIFFKYPKVGEPNSVVKVLMYDAEEKQMIGEVAGLEPSDYAPRIHWTPGNQLIMYRLNRMQDTLELLTAMPERVVYDPEDDSRWIPSRLLMRETDPAYVDIHDNQVFLKEAAHFIWSSESDGYNHVYLYPTDRLGGEKPRCLTPGRFDVTTVYGVNESTGKFYYQTATPTPMDRQIWEGSLDGQAPRLLTPGTGTHNAVFSPSFEFWIHNWSDANTPNQIWLQNLAGDTLRTLIDNKRVRKLCASFEFVKKEFWQFALPSGDTLNGWMLRPDSLEPGTKYPVLFDVYGGPGSQTVLNEYDGYMDPWRQMLVQKGIVVVSVDNRGTGGRGSAFKKCTQLQLGKLETQDQMDAARYLGTLPWVDPDRIGIWGWSYGGYLSSSCVLKGKDVFEMAVAVAPVTNWKWYDSAYTERYMHTMADNARGYNENSPINFVQELKGDNYLICHGTADDNVHFQNSAEMINALIAAGKQFDMAYYPNRNHGIYGDNATRHLFAKITAYLEDKL